MTDQPATMRRPRPRPQAEEAPTSDDLPVNPPVEDDEDEDSTASVDLSGLSGGWSNAQRQQDATSTYAQALKPDKEMQFVKFLDNVPYANYRRHWVERSGERGPYKRPYVCLQTVGKRCPLCDIGERPQAVSAFNVALLDDDGQVTLKSWDLAGKVFGAVKTYANDPRIGPLTKGYFGVNMSTNGKGNNQTNVTPIGPSAARDDYNLPIPTQEQLDALVKYDVNIIDIPKTSALEEIADEMAADD